MEETIKKEEEYQDFSEEKKEETVVQPTASSEEAEKLDKDDSPFVFDYANRRVRLIPSVNSYGFDIPQLTTKGDLAVRGASYTEKLAVGNNDEVLTADSTASSGVKWATNVKSIIAGTNTTIDPVGGTGDVTINASDQTATNLKKTFTAVGTVTAGDVVSLIESGSQNILFLDHYTDDVDFGRQNNINHFAIQIISPINITGFSFSVDLQIGAGTPDDVVLVQLESNSADLPSGTILETETIQVASIGADYTTITVTFDYALVAGTKYWVAVRMEGNSDANNYYHIKAASGTLGLWGFYFLGAGANTESGIVWSASNVKINFTLTKTLTAGVYKIVDVPNNIHAQGGIQGVVSSVDGSNATVILEGIYTGSGFTVGSKYFLSDSTAGVLATTGNCEIGYAVSTTELDIYSKKRCLKSFSGSLFKFNSSPDTINVMLGFTAQKMKAVGIGSPGSSVGFYEGGIGYGVKFDASAQPTACGIWSTSGDDGSSGTPTINKSYVSFAVTSTAITKDLIGTIWFEN